MGIKQDAGNLVLYFYKRKIQGKPIPQVDELIKLTKWEAFRFENAIGYCEEKYFIMLGRSAGSDENGINNMEILDITYSGVDMVEATNWNDEGKKEFFNCFNLVINNEFNIDSIVKGEVKLF